MRRSSKRERAERINVAVELLQQGQSSAEAAQTLSQRFEISCRQAYRYLQVAEQGGRKVPIPRPKIAFTVKLSQSLIQRLRQYAQSRGQSLSEIVTQALDPFLPKRQGRGEKRKAR